MFSKRIKIITETEKKKKKESIRPEIMMESISMANS